MTFPVDLGHAINEVGCVAAHRTTTLLATTPFTAVTFDLTDVENEVSEVEHDDTNRERIYARVAGTFSVTSNLEFTNAGVGDRTLHFQFLKNGTTAIKHLDVVINRQSTMFVTRHTFVTLAKNDYIQIELDDAADSGDLLLEANAIFTMAKM
jgi:hypothetical protein